MKMHLDNIGNNLVTDYGLGGISVNGKLYTENLVISTSAIKQPWMVHGVLSLTIEEFDEALALKPEILLLGTGSEHIFPPLKLQADVAAQGCALEVMSTSAACRTYNVLVGEYRQVVAALFQLR